jgi:hypothetical protein
MDFLDRIGQLNIPTGLQGSQGPAGTNGAGWTSQAGNPRTAPPADIKYYLNTTNGRIFEWDGSNWVTAVTTIFGTNGNVWFSGVVNPNTITVAGAVVNDFFLDTVLGDIYKLVGVSWVLQLTIKGTNGTNGTNGSPGARVPIRTHYTAVTNVSGGAVGGLLGDQGFTLSEFFPKIGDWIKFEVDTTVVRPAGTTTGINDVFSFDIVFSDNSTTNYLNLAPQYSAGTSLFNSLALSNCALTCPSRAPFGQPFSTEVCSVNIIAKLYRVDNATMAYNVTYTAGTSGEQMVTKTFKNVINFNFNNATGAYKVNIYNQGSAGVSLRASNTTITVEKYEMPPP